MVQKVAAKLCVRGWVSQCDDWETLSENPAVNGHIFRIREEKGEGWAPSFICCVQDSNSNCPLRLLGYGTP